MPKFPFSRQTNDVNCGPACLQMVLAYFSKRVSQEKLAALAKTTKSRGTEQENMVKALARFGIKAKAKAATIRGLADWVGQGNLAIVDYFLEKEKVGHYAVVVSFGKKQIGLNDPWLGKTQYYITYFGSVWHDPLTKIKNLAILIPKKQEALHAGK